MNQNMSLFMNYSKFYEPVMNSSHNMNGIFMNKTDVFMIGYRLMNYSWTDHEQSYSISWTHSWFFAGEYTKDCHL